VSSYRVHVRTRHPLHWDENNCSMQANNTAVDMAVCECETEECENVSHMPISDQAIWNSFLKDCAEHLASFRLKVTEGTFTASVCSDFYLSGCANYVRHIPTAVY
jgi:hypothetical protein